jgi:hypothetical protein
LGAVAVAEQAVVLAVQSRRWALERRRTGSPEGLQGVRRR